MVKPDPERCFCTLLRIAKLAPDAVERRLQAPLGLQLWSAFRSASISTVPTVENVSETA
jgi:hypothetical protein